MYEELQRKVAECKELLQMTNELRNEISSTQLQLFQAKDSAAAAKKSSDQRLENLEVQVLKLKGQLVEEKEAVVEARREAVAAEGRAQDAEAASEAVHQKSAKQKSLLDQLPPHGNAGAVSAVAQPDAQDEDEFAQLHREAEAAAV
eukprot:SAG25_NODE_8130_length_438_cov_0.764012_1_plen_145_part_11